MSLTPLIDETSGLQLPPDRLLISVGEGQLMPVGSMTLPVTGPTRLRLWMRPELYDSPGLYEGQLFLTVSDGGTQPVAHVDLQIRMLPWVAIRRLAPGPLAVSQELWG